MAIERFMGDYRFLSNFYLCKVIYEGVEYPSSEHAYQASKTLDHRERMMIAALETPSKAKREGSKLRLRPDWGTLKMKNMEDVLRCKFKNLRLRALLLSTGNEELIEGNTWRDRYWGVWGGKGKNNLGILLMKLREEFRNARLVGSDEA